jgi:hypothetical protein
MSDDLEPELGDEHYEDEPPTWDPSVAEVDALIDAGWHLRQIRRLRKRADETRAVYAAELARIQEWRDRELAKWETRIEWHATPLRQLSQRFYEADPKRKTIELPDGKMRYTVPVKPQVVIDDADGLLAWAIEHAPHLLPEPKAVRVTDLRREAVAMHDGLVVLTSTGEAVPHVYSAVPEPTWYVDTEVES